MNEQKNKKKKSTTRELAVGGGLMAIFLPLIVFAVMGTLIAIIVGAASIPNIQESNTALWMVVVVYGTLLVLMLFLAYKFSARFALLTGRLIGLMRERRRIRTETRAAGSSNASAFIDPQSLHENDDSQSAQRTSR